MNIVSLFDGISCGQLALERAGIQYTNYFASEIDKAAIQITQHNYPNTIQLGDITKWRTWNLPSFDLLLCGSPCQGFSFAGRQLNFDDPRSKLFFDFIDILEHYKPKYFLMENVRMKKEFQDVITRYLGVEPIIINSSLVSAQSRSRLYWTNIPEVTQPIDKGIKLRDVVFDDAMFVGRTICRKIDADGIRHDYSELPKTQRLELRTDNRSGTLTTVAKDNTVLISNEHSLLLSDKAIAYMDRQVADGRTHWDFKHHSDVRNDKSMTVVANFFKGVPYNVLRDWNCIRYLHPVECERLQTLPDGYTEYGQHIPEVEQTCAKQLVVAIIENKGKFWVGTNECLSPQTICPREGLPTGVGYEKCLSVCQQKNHAEVNACIKAGKHAKGGTLYLIGHTYYCEECNQVMQNHGITEVVIGRYPSLQIPKTKRYKAIGNGWTVDVIAHILKGVRNA